MAEPRDPDDDDPDDDDDEPDEDDGFEGTLFRIHGIGRVSKESGKLVIRRQILVEDESDCPVRLRLTTDNQFGGDDQTINLGDEELVELIRALELVAHRRGLINPSGN